MLEVYDQWSQSVLLMDFSMFKSQMQPHHFQKYEELKYNWMGWCSTSAVDLY
jgi:hypothetical protein